jgi:class 3 adenylate cyclase
MSAANNNTITDFRVQERWLLAGKIRDDAAGTRWGSPPTRLQVETWLRASRSAIIRHGGAINQFTPDGFLASWPWSPESSRQLAQTLDRFCEIRDFVALRFHLALHMGEVSVGIGNSSPEMGLFGREVKFVRAMEGVAIGHRNWLLISAEALAGSYQMPAVRGIGPVGVPGFAGDFELFAD